MDVQVQMTERAIELLMLPEDEPCFILDIGCGSGLSGSVLEDQGHFWIGMDISTSMLGMFYLFLSDLVIFINLLQTSQSKGKWKAI